MGEATPERNVQSRFAFEPMASAILCATFLYYNIVLLSSLFYGAGASSNAKAATEHRSGMG